MVTRPPESKQEAKAAAEKKNSGSSLRPPEIAKDNVSIASATSESKISAVEAPKPRRGSVFLKKSSARSDDVLAVEDICDDYVLHDTLSTGRHSRISLATHRASDHKILLKIFPKAQVKVADFLRDYNTAFFLSAHHNIADTYQGVYASPSLYFFVQETFPYGTLEDAISATNGLGLPENTVKRFATQIGSAMNFMHEEGLVHRALTARNVLIYSVGMDKVKLADFWHTRNEGTRLRQLDQRSAYHAPELCECIHRETYAVHRSIDVWAFGILLFYALRGRLPWERATIMNKGYWEWEEWAKNKRHQLPLLFLRFTEPFTKFFKKALAPRWKDRCDVNDVNKYMKHRWMKSFSKSISEHGLSTKVEDPNRPKATSDAFSTQKDRLQQRQFLTSARGNKRRSVIHSWIASTLTTMTEISEQVVSAADSDE